MALRKALLIVAAASMAVVVGALLPVTARPEDNHVVREQTFWSGTDIHVVGEIDGWTLGVNYDDWARDNAGFLVGDTLVFRYDPAIHNVVQVNEDGYNRCIVGNGGTWSTGDDFLHLGAAGRLFFICGMGDHCARGMKLAITVN